MTAFADPPRGFYFPPPAPSARLRENAGTGGAMGPWEELLSRANRGDQAAFARFLTEISPVLRGIIRAKAAGLSHDQHEDILQDVLLAIHLKRHTWQQDMPVRPWLYTITRYKVIDTFRKRGRAVHVPIEDFDDILPSDAGTPDLAGRDTETMLAMIDPRSAAIVRAVALDGDSAEEAGERMGLSAGAARVALHRAMKRLARIAEGMGK